MQFHYIAADASNKTREGDKEGKSTEEILAFVFSQGWKPISIKPLKQVIMVKQGTLFERVTLQDKIFLFKYLSLMLKVGTDLFKAIDVLLEDTDKPLMRSLLLEIKTNLERGNPLYVSFENHPDIFSLIVVNLLKAAEASGNLEQSMEDISATYAKEAEVKGKIQSALIYPVLLLVVASGVVGLMVTFVLPKMSTMFEGSDAKIPLFSLIVIRVGQFLNANIVWIVPLMLVLIGGLAYFFIKVPAGQKAFDTIMRKTPLVKTLLQKIALRRFASTFGSLLKAGIPFIQALEITADAVGEMEFRAAILRIARENIAKGTSVADAFRKETVFPKVVTNLISIGEKSGHVEEILGTLAKFYEDEIDSALKTLVAIFEPAMLLFIGFIVAGIAISVILPIYQLVNQYS